MFDPAAPSLVTAAAAAKSDVHGGMVVALWLLLEWWGLFLVSFLALIPWAPHVAHHLTPSQWPDGTNVRSLTGHWSRRDNLLQLLRIDRCDTTRHHMVC